MGKGSRKVIPLVEEKVLYDIIPSEEQEAVMNQINAAYGEGFDIRYEARMRAYRKAERELRREGLF